MGFFKDIISNPVNSIVFGPVAGGLMNRADRKEEQAVQSEEQKRISENERIMSNANQKSLDKQAKFYGSSLDNLGQESTDYANRTKANLDKNVAEADLYNQQAGQQRALDNARAGLSGVDTSAMNEQSRRNASFGAAAINESAKRNALDLYGQSISNRITGANTIDTQEQALGIASLQQPVAQASNNGGILSSIFSGIF